jgi:hypothetical protein
LVAVNQTAIAGSSSFLFLFFYFLLFLSDGQERQPGKNAGCPDFCFTDSFSFYFLPNNHCILCFESL